MKKKLTISIVLLVVMFAFETYAAPKLIKNGIITAAESTVDVKNYLATTSPSKMLKLVNKISGMKKKKNKIYPTLYYAGNKMKIGVNRNAEAFTSKNKYVFIENSGNKNVTYYGMQIGDSQESVLKKFKKMRYVTYDNGKSYSNANAFSFYPKFSKGKLISYTYISAPTS